MDKAPLAVLSAAYAGQFAVAARRKAAGERLVRGSSYVLYSICDCGISRGT